MDSRSFSAPSPSQPLPRATPPPRTPGRVALLAGAAEGTSLGCLLFSLLATMASPAPNRPQAAGERPPLQARAFLGWAGSGRGGLARPQPHHRALGVWPPFASRGCGLLWVGSPYPTADGDLVAGDGRGRELGGVGAGKHRDGAGMPLERALPGLQGLGGPHPLGLQRRPLWLDLEEG